MAYRVTRTITSILAVTLLSQTLALGQDPLTPASPPATERSNGWEYAPLRVRSGAKLFVITMAQPTRRTICHVGSFTVDQLACRGPFGVTRIYKPQEIAALIVPGDEDLKLRLVIGLNTALAAAIWGTVVLAPICPPCAVATGIAAFCFFGAAGAVLVGDDQPDSLLYLAPGQQLHFKRRLDTSHQASDPSQTPELGALHPNPAAPEQPSIS